LGGGKVVTGILIQDKLTEKNKVYEIQGLFIAIGHQPNTDMFKPVILTDELGYIITKPFSTVTNIDGVFCCGDAQDKIFRQAVTAAGAGCMTALEAERYFVANQDRLVSQDTALMPLN